MKVHFHPFALILLASVLAIASAQDGPDCPKASPFEATNFALPSGDACTLCVPDLGGPCGVACRCPTMQCDTYKCEFSPADCGEAVCSGDGRQIFPTPAPTPVPTTQAPTMPPVPPTVPFPTVGGLGTGILNPGFVPPVEGARDDCGYTTCLGCLSDPSCGSWYNLGIGCFDTCAVADASCYNQAFNPGQTAAELCNVAMADEANQQRCNIQVNCAGCTVTPLADGSGNCAWYREGGFCAPPGCFEGECGDSDPFSCPGAVRPLDTPAPADCGSQTSCGDCLSTPGCDAWSTGQCFHTCLEAPMDVACYSQEYINGTPEAICQQAENDGADAELCGMQSDCGSCTGTTLISDGTSTCQWFDNGGGPDGYCASGCDMMGCGVTTCTPDCGEGLCPDPSGACRLPGDNWFLDDGCSRCECMEGGDVACVGCPLQEIDEEANLSFSQVGLNCDGIGMDVTCTIKGDDSTACHKYLPSDSSKCTVEVKYSYKVRQEAPPQNAILMSVIRQREDSYHGSPRNFVENRWGENLTPTSMAYYEISSVEFEFVNFCLKNIKPSTVFEFKTDVCTTTGTYEMTPGPEIWNNLPDAPATVAGAKPKRPSVGGTTEGVNGKYKSKSAAATGASTIRFFPIFVIGAMLMAW